MAQNKYHISIHYMLSVQILKKNLIGSQNHFNTLYVVGSSICITNILSSIVFQYIICCRFKKETAAIIKKPAEFQYIICCRFNLAVQDGMDFDLVFQYIICCRFKIMYSHLSLFFVNISIHYMLSVQQFKKLEIG